MDILTYIQRINQLYGSEQQVASAKFGEGYAPGAPEQIDMPNIQHIIREEGIQVGQQVKDGGRIYDTRKYFNGGQVGTPTGMVTEYGRKVYETPGGEKVSERSRTLKLGDTWVNVPSIHNGVEYDQVQLKHLLIN